MPTTVAARSLYRIALMGSMPRGLVTPPRVSLIATIFAFFSAKIRATAAPVFPNPCTATLAPRSDIFFSLHASSTIATSPCAAASWLPTDPPIDCGFPVTTPCAERPTVIA